jgi:peptidoglycan hydrolase-like protein with peptidoglycan-binding domain
MVAFIIGAGLGKHLRTHNWAGFAHGYNGPRYAENQYDRKLANAHARISRGASAAYDPLADGLLSVGDKGDAVKALQLALGIRADGDFGSLTAQDVSAFQREHGLTVDGKVGKQTGKMLGLTFWGT